MLFGDIFLAWVALGVGTQGTASVPNARASVALQEGPAVLISRQVGPRAPLRLHCHRSHSTRVLGRAEVTGIRWNRSHQSIFGRLERAPHSSCGHQRAASYLKPHPGLPPAWPARKGILAGVGSRYTSQGPQKVNPSAWPVRGQASPTGASDFDGMDQAPAATAEACSQGRPSSITPGTQAQDLGWGRQGPGAVLTRIFPQGKSPERPSDWSRQPGDIF